MEMALFFPKYHIPVKFRKGSVLNKEKTAVQEEAPWRVEFRTRLVEVTSKCFGLSLILPLKTIFGDNGRFPAPLLLELSFCIQTFFRQLKSISV